MDFKKYFLFLLSFLFITIFSFSTVYASDTCTEGTDCQESINENTYNIDQKLDDLNTYLSVDRDNPVTLVTQASLQAQVDDFNDNMTQTLQVFGIFSGLLLFASAFNLGLFLYKR